jgi:hypothetical protein
MDFGEPVAVLVEGLIDDCPFDHNAKKRNLTNDFSNSSKVLASKMPPKEKKPDIPSMSFTLNGKTEKKPLGHQAHHLIPGEAIKRADPLKEWISKKPGNVNDNIGYLQNDKRNGAWLPASHAYKGWGALLKTGKHDVQYAYAYAAMQQNGGRQFHQYDSSHGDYNDAVLQALERIKVDALEFRQDCDKCTNKTKKPFDAPYDLLDRMYDLSTRLDGYVRGSPKRWKPPFCTSDYAVLYGTGLTPDKFSSMG